MGVRAVQIRHFYGKGVWQRCWQAPECWQSGAPVGVVAEEWGRSRYRCPLVRLFVLQSCRIGNTLTS